MASKKTVKKAVKPKPSIKSLSVTKMFSKSEIVQSITEMVGIARKQAVETLDALAQIISAHISKKGPGAFMLPGLAKFRVISKPATKSRKGINSFTKEPTTFAAKPARNVIKIRPLKKLKDMLK